MKPIKWTGRGSVLATALAAGLAALTTGCQTALPVTYTEPASFDMRGISKVGIISDNAEIRQSAESALAKHYAIANAEEMNALMPWLRQQSLLATSIEVSAADLVNEYDANEVRADGIYDGKILKVAGTVTDFRAGAVRLGVDGNSVDVYIMKAETPKVAELNKGDAIIVVGKCFGLKAPESDGINEILEILGGGGRHVNLANATFFIPEYTGPVDAVLTANETHTEKSENQVKDKPQTAADGKTPLKDADGKTIYKKVTEYRKVVSVTVSYRLTNTENGALIGNGSASGEARSDYAEDMTKLPATSTLVSRALKQPIQKLISDMIPTERTLSVKLIKSDTTDANTKSALSDANKLVKAKEYGKAADAYGKIYADTKDFAAGYNQAVLTEVARGTDKAVTLMEALAKASGRNEAKTMLDQMQRRNAANQRSAEQLKK